MFPASRVLAAGHGGAGFLVANKEDMGLSQHYVGVLSMEVGGVPVTSTHWMGLNTIFCNSWSAGSAVVLYALLMDTQNPL